MGGQFAEYSILRLCTSYRAPPAAPPCRSSTTCPGREEKGRDLALQLAQLGRMIFEELRRLATWSERHRRLLARILIAVGLTVVIDLVGALLAWEFESGVKGSDIHGFGDAFFFASVQLLTVSSS